MLGEFSIFELSGNEPAIKVSFYLAKVEKEDTQLGATCNFPLFEEEKVRALRNKTRSKTQEDVKNPSLRTPLWRINKFEGKYPFLYQHNGWCMLLDVEIQGARAFGDTAKDYSK